MAQEHIDRVDQKTIVRIWSHLLQAMESYQKTQNISTDSQNTHDHPYMQW